MPLTPFTDFPKYSMKIRDKLIAIFILIKIVPLLLLAWIAWEQTKHLSQSMDTQINDIVESMSETLTALGEQSSEDSIQALNNKSREAVERLSNITAQQVAEFLYERDTDILSAALLPIDEKTFQQFLQTRQKNIIVHAPYEFNEEKAQWMSTQELDDKAPSIQVKIKENRREFNYSPPQNVFGMDKKPLYTEMTFIDLNGNEKVKITTGDITDSERRNVANPQNTYVKAEHYFKELQKLSAGEIYVSNVIGAYVSSKVIGPYTPASTTKAGIDFEPEKSAYAGKENPLGKRFQGIIRWATPYIKNGKKIGYITLALDHTHLMEFTDYLVPTEERFSNISNAATGNYAFMWDNLGRNISHPRDYFITGYDPETGQPAIPWLSKAIYDRFISSKQPYHEFQKTLPSYAQPGSGSKPAIALKKQGYIALDCRYLDFAPQCAGWHNLTSEGGSGSFVIFWSSLWKLTTASTIPYYTGQYGQSKRGFGYVTIGVNVEQFHQPALTSKANLLAISEQQKAKTELQKRTMLETIEENLNLTAEKLSVSTLIMIILVIIIAIMIALLIARRITRIVEGIQLFKQGNLDSRIAIDSNDELGNLSSSFNQMADSLSLSIDELKHSQNHLEQQVLERTKELSLTNDKMKQEISDRKEAQARIQKIANYDVLTGLPNRFLFEENLKQAISNSLLNKVSFGLFYLDLDGFKMINDTKGHSVGDKLLKHAAQIIKKKFRASDTIARVGGDEFVVTAYGVSQKEHLSNLADNVVQQLKQPVIIDGHALQIGVSIGIAIFPDNADNYQDFVNIADTAMYRAKKDGGNCYRFFNAQMQKNITSRKQLEHDIRQALQDNEFTMYYQSRNFARNSSISGAEALIRWIKTDGKIISPAEFIPIAETNGFIIEIEQWVLRHVMLESKPWFEQGIMTHPIAINISYRHISRPEFSQLVDDVLGETGFQAKNLEIEITESAVGDNETATLHNLAHLRSLGVTLSIDDFGMGYSSFQRFRDLHIDILKIDRSFINNIGAHKDESIIRAITTMAHELDIKIIAEGVEDQNQLDFLLSEGCEQIQGFFFSRPMPADEFLQHLKENKQFIADDRNNDDPFPLPSNDA